MGHAKPEARTGRSPDASAIRVLLNEGTTHLQSGRLQQAEAAYRAGELPLSMPTKFQLVFNQRAAAQLGLAPPPALLPAANEVIS
jgi:hypothetical protein